MSKVFRGTRIARRAQPSAEERIRARAIDVGHCTWKQTDCRIDDREGGCLATAQDKIAQGDFLCRQMISDALVDVLVVATEQRELFAG